MKYILASASPRRKEILENLGLEFEIITADTDEQSDITEPALLTRTLAERKGMAVRDMLLEKGSLSEDTVIISADTLVFCDREILGKPSSPEDAERMLRLLSGRSHTVASGVALTVGDKTVSDVSLTQVYFDELDDKFIERYLASGEPYDKAGAYGIQGMASSVIKKIDGCYFGVVGLPINCLCRLARENSIPLLLN